MMAKDNTYKKENAFLVLAKRMSRNKNAMFGLTLFVIRHLRTCLAQMISEEIFLPESFTAEDIP